MHDRHDDGLGLSLGHTQCCTHTHANRVHTLVLRQGGGPAGLPWSGAAGGSTSRPAVVTPRFFDGLAAAPSAPVAAGRRRCRGRSPYSSQCVQTFSWFRAPTMSLFHVVEHLEQCFSRLETAWSRWSQVGQNCDVLYSST